jgi:glycine C-acetyltransferase/8-amino-7-oxononanoate synthase
LAAFSVLEQEPWRREQLWKNRARLATGLTKLGLDTGVSETPILPVLLGSAKRTLAAARLLLERGVYAPAIRPPSVPEGSSRIRMTVMATHTDDDIDRAIAIAATLKQEGPLAP